jgi:cytochrome c-type biogenesis protein
MLEGLFTFVDSAVKGAPAIALAVSLLWGALSIILSPCHLSSIPLIVGFMAGRGAITAKRSFAISMLFSIGILVTLALIGGITILLGFFFLSRIGFWTNLIVAILFAVIGLYLLGIIPLQFISAPARPETDKRGFVPAFFLGLFFGLALGPCSFAFMMPVLGAASSAASSNIFYSGLLVLLYAAGHCSVIVFAGTSYKAVERFMRWGEKTKFIDIVKKVCGVLLITASVYMAVDVLR